MPETTPPAEAGGRRSSSAELRGDLLEDLRAFVGEISLAAFTQQIDELLEASRREARSVTEPCDPLDAATELGLDPTDAVLRTLSRLWWDGHAQGMREAFDDVREYIDEVC